jgi:hypothetical protein
MYNSIGRNIIGRLWYMIVYLLIINNQLTNRSWWPFFTTLLIIVKLRIQMKFIWFKCIIVYRMKYNQSCWSFSANYLGLKVLLYYYYWHLPICAVLRKSEAPPTWQRLRPPPSLLISPGPEAERERRDLSDKLVQLPPHSQPSTTQRLSLPPLLNISWFLRSINSHLLHAASLPSSRPLSTSPPRGMMFLILISILFQRFFWSWFGFALEHVD